MEYTILTIRTCSKKVHEKARTAASILDKSLQDFVVLCIKEKLKRMEDAGYQLSKFDDHEEE